MKTSNMVALLKRDLHIKQYYWFNSNDCFWRTSRDTRTSHPYFVKRLMWFIAIKTCVTRYHIIPQMFDTFFSELHVNSHEREMGLNSSQKWYRYSRENNLYRYWIKKKNKFVHSACYSIVCFAKKYFSNTRIWLNKWKLIPVAIASEIHGHVWSLVCYFVSLRYFRKDLIEFLEIVDTELNNENKHNSRNITLYTPKY